MKYGLLLNVLAWTVLVSCKSDNPDQGIYQYHAASWQGTYAYSNRYQGAIRKSRRLIQKANQYNGLPGAQIAVMVDDSLQWSEGFGFSNLERGIPVSANTLFRIASVSKILTAAAVGRLVEEGKLVLDEPITTYLPEFPSHYAAITTRHLVSHQSGIRHYYGADRSSKTEHYENVEDALAIFVDTPLLFPPGTDVHYSSYGWVVVSAIIQRLAGQPFLQYMQEEIWKPMKMENTFGLIPDAKQANLSCFYGKDSPMGAWHVAPEEDLSFNWAGAGLSSTATDLARYGNELLNGTFLQKNTVDSLFTPQMTSQQETTGFGIGFIVYDKAASPGMVRRDQRIVGHGGLKPTARVYLLLFPEDNVVVAFTANTGMINFGDENILAIANYFIQEKKDQNRFVFDRTLFTQWKGVWQIIMEDTGTPSVGSPDVELPDDYDPYDTVYLSLYQYRTELLGQILTDHFEPRHLEISRISADSIEMLATLPSHTARFTLGLANGVLSGHCYFDKPLNIILKKRLTYEPERAQLLSPKLIQNGKKLE
ncbi:MAG: serine hydrolase domain-containing protein [Bacteroidota bacterium]